MTTPKYIILPVGVTTTPGFDVTTFDVTAYVIERCHQRFIKDHNPLHVWAAYRLVRRSYVPTLSVGGTFNAVNAEPPDPPVPLPLPVPLPEWIAVYFDVCADSLLNGEDPTYALGLTTSGGPGGKYGQILNAERNEAIFGFVELLVSLSEEEALAIVRNMDLEAVDMFTGGGTREDRACQFVADQTQRKGNLFSVEALSFELIRSTYYKLLKDEV